MTLARRLFRGRRSTPCVCERTLASQVADLQARNRELERRVDELQTLFEIAPIGLAVVEDRECRSVRVNPTLARWLSGAGQGEEAHDCRFVHDGHALAAGHWPLETTACDGQVFENQALDLECADGSVRHLLGSAAPLRNEAGEPCGAVNALLDVSALRCAEQEYVAAEAALAASQAAHRAKDQFLAILSHELRTPLNPICGWTQLLRRGRIPVELQTQALESIERNARLQLQMIEDLLDVARIVEGRLRLQRQPVAPAPLVHAAIETIRPTAEASGVILEARVEGEPPTVLADPVRLQQVTSNLLTNAVKFTPAGGRVRVSLGSTDGRMRLEVSDTGIGIRPEFMPHLFERFRQGDHGTVRSQGGLGLGLFVVRHLVEAHGGRVWAESEGEGQGSRFTVELPVSG